MKLIVFNYGMTYLNEKMAFINGDESLKVPIGLLFFLIEYQGKRILVDVGCDDLPGFKLHKFKNPVMVLESYGIKQTEITDVIITHSHIDHIGSLYNYSNAVIYTHRAHFECAKKYIQNSQLIISFDESYKLNDDIEIKCIGGHCEGSSVVLINCEKKHMFFVVMNVIQKKISLEIFRPDVLLI